MIDFNEFKKQLLALFVNPDYFDVDMLKGYYNDFCELPAFRTVGEFAKLWFQDWEEGTHGAWLNTEKPQRDYMQECRIRAAKKPLVKIKSSEKEKVKKVLGSKTNERKNAIKRLDTVFSIFIRLRDSDSNGYCMCISSGKVFHWKQVDCGHYINRSNMALRWNENNCHAQSRSDNRFFEGAITEYRKNLIKKIGLPKVELIESQVRTKKKWHVSEINHLIEYYKGEVKRLKSIKNAA